MKIDTIDLLTLLEEYLKADIEIKTHIVLNEPEVKGYQEIKKGLFYRQYVYEVTKLKIGRLKSTQS